MRGCDTPNLQIIGSIPAQIFFEAYFKLISPFASFRGLTFALISPFVSFRGLTYDVFLISIQFVSF